MPRQATPLGQPQSPEKRAKQALGENVVSTVVSSIEIERAKRILRAAVLENVAELLSSFGTSS